MTEQSKMEPGKKSRRFTDEQTDKRNHEHLTNEHDEISEDDINNIRTDESLTKDTAEDHTDDSKDVLDNDSENDTDAGMETPWDILES
ncbi:MAG: hypothetical protein ABIO04_04705 [Ferruginibacter sp.]